MRSQRLIAIHGVVAAGNRRDLADADLAHLFLKLLEVAGAALGRSVASVHEAVHENFWDSLLLRHLEQRVKMREQRMYAAIAAQAHQMQPVRTGMAHGIEQDRIAEEFSGGDHLIDTRHVHVG